MRSGLSSLTLRSIDQITYICTRRISLPVILVQKEVFQAVIGLESRSTTVSWNNQKRYFLQMFSLYASKEARGKTMCKLQNRQPPGVARPIAAHCRGGIFALSVSQRSSCQKELDYKQSTAVLCLIRSTHQNSVIVLSFKCHILEKPIEIALFLILLFIFCCAPFFQSDTPKQRIHAIALSNCLSGREYHRYHSDKQVRRETVSRYNMRSFIKLRAGCQKHFIKQKR